MDEAFLYMVNAFLKGWKRMSVIQTRIVLNRFVFCEGVGRRLLSLLVLPLVLLAGCATAPSDKTASSTPTAPAREPAAKKPLKIGLALGGGAARGFAHVGVIAVLEEAGLRPQVVVGTSAGSLVAALYASGKTSAQLQQTALNMEEVAFTDWMLPIVGRG